MSDPIAPDHHDSDTHDEAYSFIDVKQDKKTLVKLQVKVDTGAQGNTLPLHMYRRMYPGRLTADGFPKSELVSNQHTILHAYNNTKIKHMGQRHSHASRTRADGAKQNSSSWSPKAQQYSDCPHHGNSSS